MGDSDLLFRTLGGGLGNSVPPLRSKTCTLAVNMGIVGVRDDSNMETVAVGRDGVEFFGDKRRKMEEDMKIDKDERIRKKR